MSDMIVIVFETETGAEKLRDALLQIQQEHHIAIDDSALVIRGQEGKVKVKRVHRLTGAGALGGASFGLLMGLLFLIPPVGLAAVGAAVGGVGGHFLDLSLENDYLKEIRETIEPGNSALFLLVQDVTPEVMLAVLQQSGGKIMKTSLSNEDEARLRAAFEADES
jgi:uncharacterized membrane protein